MPTAITTPAASTASLRDAGKAAAMASTATGVPAAQTGRSADGDKVRSATTSQTEDADGECKPAVRAAAATSTAAVMAAVMS